MRDLRAGCLVVALLSLSLASAHAQSTRQATVAEVRGDVSVKLAGGEWQPAAVGALLNEKDEIKTAAGGYAQLLLDENGQTAQVELKENSHMRLNTMSRDPETGNKTTLLDLAIGRVLVHAEKLQGDSKFEVRTPTSTTGVRGTVFEVSAEKESPTP
ncbi:MAG: FecR domain-containing protein [Candidatus Omnitrophica bacterium]|nr:FecR domain-containing protein [Candidatus Omnitrophota bacterium]